MRFFRGKLTTVTLGMLLLAGAMFVKGVSAATRADVKKDATVIPITTQIVIPGSKVENVVTGAVVGRVRDLADYLNLVYNWLISIVGIIAAVMMMIGGFQYLTSGGEAGRVKQAKERIGNALIGLVLAFSSYLLLNTINPELVNLKVPELAGVRTELAFLPWCDELAVKLGKDPDTDTTVFDVRTVGRADPHRSCGKVGFIIKDDGSRVWCAYKGKIGLTPKDNHCGVDYIGCKTCQGGLLPVMQVCVPNGTAQTAAELDAIFQEQLENLTLNQSTLQQLASRLKKRSDGQILTVEEVTKYVKGMIEDFHTFINFARSDLATTYDSKSTDPKRAATPWPEYELFYAMNYQTPEVAECTSCPHLTNTRMFRMGLPVGDEGCARWQNMANNNNPDDTTFKISQKKPADPMTGAFWDAKNPNRMYYCGYSEDLGRCVYSILKCNVGAVKETTDQHQKIEKCSSYNGVSLYHCMAPGRDIGPLGGEQTSKGTITCFTQETLGSSRTQGGYATHLANVCDPDPCETKGPNSSCNGPIAAPGVNQARTLFRGVSFGFTGQTECE